MNVSLLITIGVIHLIALASPGPDIALMLRFSARRRAALSAALGIATGILVHSILSLTGISLLIQAHPLLFTLVRLAGAIYLGWMGWGALRAAFRPASELKAANGGASGNGFWTGLNTNLLNPKALVFFIGLLAALVGPDVNWLTRTALVVELFALSLAWFVLLAWWLSSPRIQLRLQAWSRPINGLCGLLFCSVAGSILWLLVGSPSI
ncbi:MULTISPECIES: LysE family translocator [Oceanimonas]|uniref:Lysine transporter LysE n=1 Tax=Oceanimonas doudoroffii TaxID=84158 RepID=A0A233RE49_9GAMM|nr:MULTISPECIES: LysE family transporter [Oceanimonas]NHH99215.1 Threonine efflux protein [Oceanimonas sp. MB9]OXY81665.1 lysine transporter LysE [Oceanimonas doudoroffii]